MEVTDPQLIQVAEMVAKSVEVILDPGSSSTLRAEAQAYYDNLRTNWKPQELSSLGFMIVSANVSQPVIHAGLQLIQNSVNYHWNKFSEGERTSIKEMFLVNIRDNTTLESSSVLDTPFLQEALARIIVEIAKREWPQLWPDLMPQLLHLSATSNVPFLVLRRLVEDVVTLGTVDSQKRKTELMQSLNLTANDTVTLLFKTLADTITQFLLVAKKELGPRIEIILAVISVYFEWVNTSNILTGGRILSLLTMLQLKQFNVPVADCLVQIMERKGTKREAEVPREFLLDQCSQCIISSISACGTEDNDLTFLQKIGEVLMLLGSTVQIESHGSREVENFSRCVMTLATQGNLEGLVSASTAYNNFLKNMQRHPEPRPDLVPHFTDLISTLVQKFLTTPNPAEKREMVSLKQNLCLLLRTASRLDAKFYLFVNQLYHVGLQSEVPIPCFQWDTIAFVVEAVASCVPHGEDGIVDTGLNDLRLAFKRFTAESDPLVKSSYLSVVSALFAFLNLAKEANRFVDAHLLLMKDILTSVFACFVLTIENTETEHSLRTHAASLLIKLAMKFPSLLSTSFDFLDDLARVTAKHMKNNEILSAMECLFILSNTWGDFDRQKQLIENSLKSDTWLQIQELVASPDAFLNLFAEPMFMEKKSMICMNLNMLFATLRRVPNTWVEGTVEEEQRHPAFEVFRQVLPTVFQYVKLLYCLIELPQFQNALDLTETEKTQILGIVHSPGVCAFQPPTGEIRLDPKNDSFTASVKRFIHTTFELSYTILGSSCYVFSHQLYRLPNIQDPYLNCVGWKLQNLSDFRVRVILRLVYRPFLHGCPASKYESVLLPFMRAFAPFMFERLTTRWRQVQAVAVDSDGDEEVEIIQNSVLRLLTREYLDALIQLLEYSTPVKPEDQILVDDIDMDDGDEMQGAPEGSFPRNSTIVKEFISEFGILLLKDQSCFQSIIHLCGMALCWDDSGVSYRAARILGICWDYVALQNDVILGVFTNALLSVCVWAEFEVNMGPLVRLIDLVHNNFHKQEPRITQMLLEWGAAEDDLRKLSSSAATGLKNDKKRKDIIRRMVKNNPNLESNKIQKPSWLEGMPNLTIRKQKMNTGLVDIDLNEYFSSIETFGT